MIVFPAAAFAISLGCAVVVGLDAARKPRPDRICWTIAFALFAVAAGTEVAGAVLGWTPAMVHVYYLAGAVLVVGYLALGELYLLAADRIGRFAPGAALLVTALAASAVFAAPVDPSRLAADGWRAIDKGPGLVALAVSINAIGTLALAGGAFWSAWQFRRDPSLRNRMLGCLLIGAGALVVAAGGSLTRLGSPQYLYIARAAGVALIVLGYWRTRTPATAAAGAGGASSARLVPVAAGGRLQRTTREDTGLGMISRWLQDLDPAAVRAECLAWSATPGEEERLAREDARMTWRLRAALPESLLPAFDALPVATRRQLAEVCFEVFSAGQPDSISRRAG
ncbi:MAG: hypothetical protein ACKOWF_01345 [Chloroflexota bacterium]